MVVIVSVLEKGKAIVVLQNQCRSDRDHLHQSFRWWTGWSGGAMVLGKLPVPGRPTIWITVGQGPTALAVGAGGGCLDIFTLIYPFFPLSPSLWETARYRLKYCLKGPLNPKSTNQPTGGGRVVRWCWETSSAGASHNFDYSRARAYCACSRCGWGWLGHFYSHLSFLPLFGRRPDID